VHDILSRMAFVEQAHGHGQHLVNILLIDPLQSRLIATFEFQF